MERPCCFYRSSFRLKCCLSKGLFDCPVEVLLCYSACATDGLQFILCRLSNVSVDPARGCGAVGVTSWMRAMAVGTHSFVGATVPVWSLVPICSVTTVCTTGYSGAAGGVTVALAAWVVALYSRVLVDYF
jgi:hypothetical protein